MNYPSFLMDYYMIYDAQNTGLDCLCFWKMVMVIARR